jgi:hypothetical protein
VSEPKGATREEWYHLDFVLGLGANLLPCVPAGDDVRVLAGSALEGKVGKIPSQFNRNGEAHGLKDWQKRDILSNEVQLWSQDRRLNICIRTGPISGVYALDVDIEDLAVVNQIHGLLFDAGLKYGWRYRENSTKFLIPFRLEGGSCKKRIIKTPHGNIELLADGQQFVAAGSHSSGVRYQWSPELPSSLPTMSMDQLNSVWTTLTTFATPESAKVNRTVQAQAPSLEIPPEVLTTISDAEWEELIAALRFLVPHAGDEETWSRIGMALLSIKDSGKPAKQLWLDFSRKAPNWQDGAAEEWWSAHAR